MNPLPPALTYLCSILACALLLLLFAATSANACINVRSVRQSLSISQELSIPANQRKKRILALRRSETPDGVRLTLVSDAPLDDYRSYVEGERFFIHIPQAAFINPQQNPQGRGFADMRIEQRDDDLVLSFRLQQGATVNIKQLFHQLHLVFYTNEQTRSRSNT
jgi:hypothetical protein